MTALENKQIVQAIFNELAQGNSRPLVEAMVDDFSWTVSGSNRWSGTYQGKQAVLNDLLGSCARELKVESRPLPTVLSRKAISWWLRPAGAILQKRAVLTTTHTAL